MTLFFFAFLPILWLIVALSGFKLAAWQACPVALVLSLAVSSLYFGMPWLYTASAALEGTALACWPILLIIIATIYTYNLSVHTKGIDIIKEMLMSVSTDYRVLILLIAFGFGGFLEGMAGFGTAVAIPASMLFGIGLSPVNSVAVCLIANFVPSAYGSIGIPLVTLSGIMGANSSEIATYVALQILFLGILCPFLMIATAGKSLKAVKGVFPVCLASGLAYSFTQLAVSYFMGPELAGVTGSIVTMGAIIATARMFPTNETAYSLPKRPPSRFYPRDAFMAWLPFILIFVFLLLTSKLVPLVYESLILFQTSVLIYQGEGGLPYTFYWVATPGTIIFLAAFTAAFAQKVAVRDMLMVLKNTVIGLRFTIITIITIIATAKVMGYSGMTTTIAAMTVERTGTLYPLIAAFIGSVGGFITGSATSTCILFGKLQMDAAQAIGASPTVQAWVAAANATGACAGKLIAPQSIAIGVAAIGTAGAEAEGKLLPLAMRIYIPFIVFLGLVVYAGSYLLE
ncbi:MAG: lactate permease LctP family transporter [Selenomonadaceae bacterium]|nr:lactate permease LctP family transporter [Selenomonadaceae bacterium]